MPPCSQSESDAAGMENIMNIPHIPNHSLPYPPTDGIMKDTRLINDTCSARVSELAAISDYSYYSLIFEEHFPLASELFDKIAMTEMHHFRLLGEMGMKFGGNPFVRLRLANDPVSLPLGDHGAHVLRHVLEAMIECELRARDKYARLADVCRGDVCASAVFERLSADEDHHARMLSRLLDEFVG